MAQKNRFTWLISPKSFIELLGAEYELMKKSDSKVLVKFYISGVALLAILIISILSIFYAMELLFHMLHIELLMSGFISLLFVFIYVFLLNTFSKEESKAINVEARPIWQKKISLSDVIRISFIVFMAFLISKPIEVFLFEKKLDAKVIIHKNAILKEYSTKVEKLNRADIERLNASIGFHKQQLLNYYSVTMSDFVGKEEAQLRAIKEKQVKTIEGATLKIEQSDFFIYRSQQVSRLPLAWLICLSMAILFLLPFILINTIPADDEYYKFKKANELSMIMEEYLAFLSKYTLLFQRHHQLKIEHYTDFEDPPINKKRKPKPNFNPQDDFLKKYSG